MKEIKNLELTLEFDLSFPIIENLNMVQTNDILVSDMYLSQEFIMKLINKHKILENKLYVTYSGKSDNSFWKNKEIVSKINLHYGDNYISDYKNPIANNINAIHVNNVGLNSVEKDILKINKYLAYSIRALRLSVSYHNELTVPFFEYVLPFILIVCLNIKNICKKNNIETIIFLSRDGYWFHEFYNILFPSDKTEYLYFSRLLVKNNKDIVVNKINSIIGKKFVFDLQGSGRTFNSLNLNDCYYFMCFLSHDSYIKNYLYKHTSEISNIKTVIEDLLLAPHGSASNYDKNGTIHLLDPEHNVQLFRSYFEGAKLFKKYWSLLNKYINFDINYNELENVTKIFFNDINYQIKLVNIVKSLINHVDNHTENYQGKQLKFYSQIEQDKYFIENIIKYKQNGVFIEIGGYDGITGSNTYFLEKNLYWDGIIVECNPNLVEKCKANRNCYMCDKALYKKDNDLVCFIIPMGDEILGGKEQLGAIKEDIKPESIVAFEKSYRTKNEIYVKTININTLLSERNIYSIDYVSIDVEGAEYSILETWDFNRHKVKFLTVEHGNITSYKNKINNLLTSKGFKLHRHNKWDDEYIYNNYN